MNSYYGNAAYCDSMLCPGDCDICLEQEKQMKEQEEDIV